MQERSNPVSRNYAEALLALATTAENREGFGVMIRDVANAIVQDATVKLFLESPRVSYERKNEILSQAFGDRVPRVFLRFLQTMVHNRRQMMIPEIATEYAKLLDEQEGRVHAEVTLARAVSDEETANIGAQLSRVLGSKVMPRVSVDPSIMGGIIVKVGNTVMDGSVSRRLSKLATHMRISA
jgi:F-type H+-transporting ATPase subunit delta